MEEANDLARVVLNCGLQFHRDIGPGLLESVYEQVLGDRLEKQGLRIDRQKPVSLFIDDNEYRNAFDTISSSKTSC